MEDRPDWVMSRKALSEHITSAIHPILLQNAVAFADGLIGDFFAVSLFCFHDAGVP